ADQKRFIVDAKINDQAFKLTKVVNGGKGWIKLNDDKAQPMNKEMLAEAQEEMYETHVVTLLPLKDKAVKLSPLGEAKVQGKDAVGVRVSHKGRRDVNLYFDKASGLLLKSEMTVKNVEDGSNKEMTQETLYSDYKEFQGTKQPTKLLAKRDGKRYVEGELSE